MYIYNKYIYFPLFPVPPPPHTFMVRSHSFATSTSSHSCPLDSVRDSQPLGLGWVESYPTAMHLQKGITTLILLLSDTFSALLPWKPRWATLTLRSTWWPWSTCSTNTANLMTWLTSRACWCCWRRISLTSSRAVTDGATITCPRSLRKRIGTRIRRSSFQSFCACWGT